MSRAEKPSKKDSALVRALVNRQVQAWEQGDFAIAADDWLPNGELFSRGGHVVKKDMQRTILDYFKHFADLKVTVNEMFLSEDGNRLAIQCGIGPSLAIIHAAQWSHGKRGLPRAWRVPILKQNRVCPDQTLPRIVLVHIVGVERIYLVLASYDIQNILLCWLANDVEVGRAGGNGYAFYV